MILPVLALGVLTGCFRLDMSEGTPVISTEDIIAPADVEVGGVIARIPVTANQSWSALILGDCPWAEIISDDHINPSDVSDDGQVSIALEDNLSVQPRSFKVKLTSRDCEKVVDVTQAGKVGRLRVIGEQTRRIDSEPEKQELSLYSNTSWTVSVKEGGNLGAKIEPSSGDGDAVLSVTIDPNYSFRQDETVTLQFTGEDIDTVSVDYVLAANVPFIRVDGESSRTELIPVDTTAVVSFLANDGWKAEIISSDIDGFVLEKTSGAEGLSELPMKLHRNQTDDIHHAVVRISLSSRPDVIQDVTITQRRGVAFYLDFSTDNHGLEPATENDIPIKVGSKYKTTDGLEHGYIFTQDEVRYTFGFQADIEYYRYSKGTFYFSMGYIRMPAIPGRKLVEVRLKAGNDSKKYLVTSDAGGDNVTPGGITTTSKSGEIIQWVLTGTDVNTSYYLHGPGKGNQIASLTIIYE